MKMKKMFFAAFMTVALMCGNTLFAQSSSYLNLGLNIPQGKFGTSTGNCALFEHNGDQGAAALGANLGFKFITDTKAKGLGFMITIDGMYNGLQKNVNLENYKPIDIPEIAGLDVRNVKPGYINVPFMLGLNYHYDFSKTISVFAEGGAGANVRFVLPFKQSFNGQVGSFTSDYTREFHYTPKVAFAFQFGGGVTINKVITLGLNYYNLGTSLVAGRIDSSLKTSLSSQAVMHTDEFKNNDLSTSMLIVRLGIRLQ